MADGTGVVVYVPLHGKRECMQARDVRGHWRVGDACDVWRFARGVGAYVHVCSDVVA